MTAIRALLLCVCAGVLLHSAASNALQESRGSLSFLQELEALVSRQESPVGEGTTTTAGTLGLLASLQARLAFLQGLRRTLLRGRGRPAPPLRRLLARLEQRIANLQEQLLELQGTTTASPGPDVARRQLNATVAPLAQTTQSEEDVTSAETVETQEEEEEEEEELEELLEELRELRDILEEKVEERPGNTGLVTALARVQARIAQLEAALLASVEQETRRELYNDDQSTTAAPQPTTAAPQPTTAAPQPTTAAPQPTTAAPQPTTAAQNVDLVAAVRSAEADIRAILQGLRNLLPPGDVQEEVDEFLEELTEFVKELLSELQPRPQFRIPSFLANLIARLRGAG